MRAYNLAVAVAAIGAEGSALLVLAGMVADSDPLRYAVWGAVALVLLSLLVRFVIDMMLATRE